jgi:hypothetical protein
MSGPQKFRIDYHYARMHWANQESLNGSKYIDSQQDVVSTFDTTSFRDGASNPNYRREIRLGLSATTDITGTAVKDSPGYIQGIAQTTRIDANKNVWVSAVQVQGIPPTGRPSNAGIVPPDIQSQVLARATSKFVEQLKSAQSSIEAGQDLGEIKQTIEGVLHPMQGLRNLTLSYLVKQKKLIRKYRRKPGAHAKALADTYLEYTFGWKPLALDIAEGCVALSNLERMSDSQYVSAGSSITYAGSRVGYTPFGIQCLVIIGSMLETSKFSVKLYGSVRRRLVNGRIPVAQSLQLLPQDFVPTVWDLLPYTFVVDYFANIGDIVRAASFHQADICWANRTFRTSTKRVYSWGGNSAPPPSDGHFDTNNAGSGSSTIEVVNMSRFPLNPDTELIPPLVFHIPLSKKPWQNIGAMITSFLATPEKVPR